MSRMNTAIIIVSVLLVVLPEIANAELLSATARSGRDGRPGRDKGELSRIAARSFRSGTRENILGRSAGQSAAARRPEETRMSQISRSLDLAKLERTVRYRPLIEHYSSLNGVDPELVAAIIYAESGGDPTAISSQGAAGLMQLMPQTAAGLGVSDRHNAEENIASGTRYLGQLLDRFGSTELALWAYNAGPTAVKRGRIPSETRQYVPRVLRVKRALQRLSSETN